MVESWNKYLKRGVEAFIAAGTRWSEGLLQLLVQYRATAPTSKESSPAMKLLGREIRLDGQPNLTPIRRHIINDSTERPRQKLTKGRYKVGEKVLIKLPHARKGLSPYSKPHMVTEVLGYWTFILDDGKKWNARRLKPFNAEGEPHWMLQPGEALPQQVPVRRSTRNQAPPKRYSPPPPHRS